MPKDDLFICSLFYSSVPGGANKCAGNAMLFIWRGQWGVGYRNIPTQGQPPPQ